MFRRKGCYVCGQRKSVSPFCILLFNCDAHVSFLERSRWVWLLSTVGHLADNCSFTERRCFNCLEAGHETSACPSPRTTETKQCYNCGGKGHIRADCPTADTKQCFGCGGKGHVKANCPTLTNGGAASGGAKGAGIRCRRCNGPNQYVAPLPQSNG